MPAYRTSAEANAYFSAAFRALGQSGVAILTKDGRYACPSCFAQRASGVPLSDAVCEETPTHDLYKCEQCGDEHEVLIRPDKL